MQCARLRATEHNTKIIMPLFNDLTLVIARQLHQQQLLYTEHPEVEYRTVHNENTDLVHNETRPSGPNLTFYSDPYSQPLENTHKKE